jgi:beta-lactamase regulating signal transducer with metallopeptidase domain
VAIVIIAVAFIVVLSFLFALQPSPANNTTNNTNSTVNSSTTNNTTVNNSTVSNQTNNNPPPPPDISSDEAKKLAQKYVGPGVTLGKPELTTYKRVHVWQVPVYTINHKFINNIYIDDRTGEKVN